MGWPDAFVLMSVVFSVCYIISPQSDRSRERVEEMAQLNKLLSNLTQEEQPFRNNALRRMDKLLDRGT